VPYADNGETSLYYEVRGEGAETIVLIPGLGLPGSAWGPVAGAVFRGIGERSAY